MCWKKVLQLDKNLLLPNGMVFSSEKLGLSQITEFGTFLDLKCE